MIMASSTMVPILRRYCWARFGVGQSPDCFTALLVFHRFELGKLLIGPHGIAAGCDKIDGLLEDLPLQMPIGIGCPDFIEQLGRIKGAGTGPSQNMLGQNIKPALAHRWRVLITKIVGIQGCSAFEQFKAIGGYKDGL